GLRPPSRGNGVGLPRSLLGKSSAAFAGTLCELRYRPSGSARFDLRGELLAGPEQLPAPHPHSPGGRRGGGGALCTIEDANKPDLLVPEDDAPPDAHGGELLGGTRRRQERTSTRDPTRPAVARPRADVPRHPERAGLHVLLRHLLPDPDAVLRALAR